jgi:asparagine synthase (glutamine-hydrolysing)
MAGLVGTTSLRHPVSEVEQCVRSMRSSITHQRHQLQDTIFKTTHLCASRVSSGAIQPVAQPASASGVSVWLDGEFYNQDALSSAAHEPYGDDDAKLLCGLYIRDRTLSFLKTIDGIYSAVIYDAAHNLLHLLTDRYGLRHIYWSERNGDLAWASEVKAFSFLSNVTLRIDPQSVDDFFSVGYLLFDRTWFQGVKLLDAGSVLTFDLLEGRIRMKKYWDWSEIPRLPSSVSVGDIVDELAARFVAAVERRSRSDRSVGVSLSGGLDSRAILAAMPSSARGPVHAVTFGIAHCDDIRIAAMAARAKPAVHHVVELACDNWLCRRLEGVWYTDGQCDLLHMHAQVSVDSQRDLYEINLNGFLGDAILGGSYCGDNRWTVEEKVNLRGRRFINEGTRLTNNYFHNRLPFFDNSLMELSYSIPEKLRAYSKIYNLMLLKAFPSFFRKIPWQRTGVPVAPISAHTFFFEKLRGAERRMEKWGKLIGIPIDSGRDYHRYPVWIRSSPSRAVFERLLLSPSPLHKDFLPNLNVAEVWRDHLRGYDRSEQLCRLMTFEVWLRQIYQGELLQGTAEDRSND